MKRCIILFLILACAYARAQEHSFKVQDRDIFWQKVFPSDLDSAGILQAVSLSGAFSDVTPVSSGISLRIVPREVDYQAAGYSRGRTPMNLLACLLSGHALIEFRPGRYRVTVDHLTLVENITTSLYEKGRTNSLESLALNKKGELRKVFQESALILEVDLSKIFSFKAKIEEDW